MLINSTVSWPNGDETSRQINWDSSSQVLSFISFAKQAFRKGASIDLEPDEGVDEDQLAAVLGEG